MSKPSRSQLELFPPAPNNEVVFDGEPLHFGSRSNYCDHAEPSIPNQTIQTHLPLAGEPSWISITKTVPPLAEDPGTWYTIDPHALSSVHTVHPSPSTTVSGGQDNHVTPTYYKSGQSDTYFGDPVPFDPPRTSAQIWNSIPNGQLGQKVHTYGQIDAVHSFYSNPGFKASPNTHLPDHQSYANSLYHTFPTFSSSLPYWDTHPAPASNLNQGFSPYVPTHHALRQVPTSRSRRKCPARAIEYNGLWIDEEEFFQGVKEPNGRITVFQCCWEEDYSPCHLWVRGNKACINMHIQKWHGGEPGKEKSKTDCRWSGCGERMLKESISRHVVSTHLGELWECQGCRKKIARKDTYVQHSAKSDFVACRTSGAVVSYAADAMVIDVRAALNSGGTLRYAGGA